MGVKKLVVHWLNFPREKEVLALCYDREPEWEYQGPRKKAVMGFVLINPF